MRKLLSLSVVIIAAAASTIAFAGEDKISLDAAPAAVQASIKKVVGAGKMGDVTKESEDGKTVYEAEFTLDKAEHSVKVSESGDVLEEETELDAPALPAAVTDAIKAKFATGKIEDASLVKAGGKTFYEVGVEVGDEDHEIKIDAAGKIIEDKVEKDEDKKDDKDDKDEKHEGHEKK